MSLDLKCKLFKSKYCAGMGAYNRKSGISKFYEVATGNLVLVVLYTQYMPCKIQFQIQFRRKQ